MYDYLRSICADVHVTKGDFDDQKGYSEDEVLSIGDFRIGLCHGHQVRVSAGSAVLCVLFVVQQGVSWLLLASPASPGGEPTL